MGKAGGIIGIIAGVFGFIAAIATLLVGGIGSALATDNAGTVVSLGWGGILFSFLAIVCGAVTISRPKGGGVALIIASILGAILGGTLVAICMALSLVGGIIAVSTSRAPSTTPEIKESGVTAAKESGKRRLPLWGLATICALFIALILTYAQNTISSKPDPIAELVDGQPSDLRPEGELSALFALGSKNTDLQRENVLKEIKGQIVQWRLPVYEVSRSGSGYKIQTKSTVKIGPFGEDLLGTFVYISPRNDQERRAIEALKTDDAISFKGRISGSAFRSLEIKPAILFVSTPQRDQQATTQENNPAPATLAPMPTQNLTPSAFEERKVISRFGQLSITGEINSMQLVLSGDKLRDGDGFSLSFVHRALSADSDIVLVMNNSGGTACPAQYFFVTLSAANNSRLSPEFGTCSDLAEVSLNGSEITVTMPGGTGRAQYVYSAGTVTENGKPIK